ncbi:hypothetical protein CYMTET_41161 [Cymbomonas tetramitiformis]|uniref:Uncharacterized protein n=1 Tax=Cymbomonas tetramitiformis TaxID=36881 RepID=A0AAE0C807_9CHLO|nr:hypothetical protein CYMTET_41161 [Cymbomonas tetramitiformis]
MTDEGSVAQLADLTAIILDVNKQLKSIADKVNGKGFTPRADKGKIGHGGGGSGMRFAAKDLPAGGIWSQTHMWKRVAFHKGSGAFVHFCANIESRKHDVRHWHRRDCPNGGKSATDDHFGNFQVAVEENNDGRFDALCMLAGGKPEMVDDVSAFSFGVTQEDAPGFMREYVPYCQPTTRTGGFSIVTSLRVCMGAGQRRRQSRITAPHRRWCLTRTRRGPWIPYMHTSQACASMV